MQLFSATVTSFQPNVLAPGALKDFFSVRAESTEEKAERSEF